MPFYLRGGEGAAKCSAIVFLVIFSIISVRHLDATVFNDAEQGPSHIYDNEVGYSPLLSTKSLKT